jgi:peptide subunit release factor 1 (eRF1)
MITRETLREIAAFQSPSHDAVTFYFQPVAPQDKSHRQDAILVKELVRNAAQAAERNGKNGDLLDTLNRILSLSEHLHGNQGMAKAVFACGSQDYWREFDFPSQFPGTRLIVNQRFHVTPMTGLNDVLGKTAIVLIDRTKARMFELQMNEIREVADLINELTRRGRSDGFLGFDAGHAERRVDNEIAAHYRRVGERLMELYGNGAAEYLILGCHEEARNDIERELHPYLQQRLIGHFVAEAAQVSPDEVRQNAKRILAEHRRRMCQEIVGEVLDEAKADNRGALGLRRVLRALQMGEIQTLLLERSFHATGGECSNCGYLDMAHAKYCAVCNHDMRPIDDLGDAIIGRALGAGADVTYVPENADLQRHGNIAALLRFRADRSMGQRMAV